MSNRVPLFILGVLVIVALVWRVANPPAPPLPGPLGRMPNWSSMTKIGDMGPAAVNPAGTMWAGAWNQTDKQGVMCSAVLVIDFEKKTSQHVGLGEGFTAASLFWRDDDTFRVLLVDSADPTLVTNSRLVICRVGEKTTKCEKVSQPTDVAGILAWPPGSSRFAARLAGSPAKTAVLDESGKVVGKEAALDVPENAKFYPIAALSPYGDSYAFAVEKSELGGTETFYMADAKTGAVKELFTSKDAPGIVEGMWLSPAGLLIAAAELGKFAVVRYDPASGKLVDVSKEKGATDVAKSWPGAPKQVLFVTFEGGYALDLQTGKTEKIISFDTSNRSTVSWRSQVQDGRLYPRKDGDYTSVSCAANAVDIRIIRKDGGSTQPLLRRR